MPDCSMQPSTGEHSLRRSFHTTAYLGKWTLVSRDTLAVEFVEDSQNVNTTKAVHQLDKVQ